MDVSEYIKIQVALFIRSYQVMTNQNTNHKLACVLMSRKTSKKIIKEKMAYLLIQYERTKKCKNDELSKMAKK
jgi:Ni,Fe-hydrogenase I cytochrome b subunit